MCFMLVYFFFLCVNYFFFFCLFNDELIEMMKYNVIDNGICIREKDIDECLYDIFLINCVICC